jgi:dihydrofolate reductase
LAKLGLIDEYHIFLHPVVLGEGEPFFAGVQPELRLVGSERIGESAVKLTYARPSCWGEPRFRARLG